MQWYVLAARLSEMTNVLPKVRRGNGVALCLSAGRMTLLELLNPYKTIRGSVKPKATSRQRVSLHHVHYVHQK